MATKDFSHLYAQDNAYIDGLYEQFQNDPTSLDESWKQFFQGLDYAIKKNESEGSAGGEVSTDISKEFKVYQLIQSYRARGHLLSTTNPVRDRKDRKPFLKVEDYGLSQQDLEKNFVIGQFLGFKQNKLGDILEYLRSLYCGDIGVEYMHCNDTEIRRWFRERFESTWPNRFFSLEKKKRILTKLNEAVVFENFLNTKYVAQKRFSLEGGENTISALDAIINKGAESGIEEFLIGMAHRGRLNVLANILGKTYDYIFNEFEGNAVVDLTMGDGDVKYHLGFSSEVKTSGDKKVYLKLMPNPSHLEAVGPVVLGYTRAQADILYNKEVNKACPILIHGDAAVAGQGVVYESLQLSELDGYHVGGAIHFVINNQIGFTTDFDDARSSFYCTSVARTLNIPVIHVNGDDAEAVVFAAEMAIEFRQKFHKDIFVDMVCYRKHGHNEADEPKYTQPTLYKKIAKHPDPRQVYMNKLIEGKEIEAQLAKKLQLEFKQMLQDRFNQIKQKPLPYYYQAPEKEWKDLKKATEQSFETSPQTGVSRTKLEKIKEALIHYPEGFKPIRKVERLLKDRAARFTEDRLDWAMAELLAYGSLLLEGASVRLSGQDCVRGTFSQRHACLFDQDTNEHYNSLNHIEKDQAPFRIFNSPLSEYAVLGFEYGYSLGRPNDINLWEAQFGDFANGAQTVIDQFISSGESKWQRMSGLFLLLPHGYEGQGSEHSNARPERFLQLAAEQNIVVANCTTPANFFHLVRRQMAWNFRKPIVVFTPKSLLRHPKCISPVKDLEQGGQFQELLADPVKDSSKVKKVIFCSGKIYYDLLERKEVENRADIHLVRIEQLYPLPEKQIEKELALFPKAQKIWVQEEPKNMGAWTFLLRYEAFRRFGLISRKSSASPATGYASQHIKEQNEILDKVFRG